VHPVWILGALAACLAVGALLFVLAQARRIKARHLRFFAMPRPALSPDSGRVVDAPRALYHGTRFADGVALLVPDWRDACVGDLWCTEEAIFLQRENSGALLVIPLESVREAALHRGRAELAGRDLPMLRLRWTRGGELLETELSMRGGLASLETLRREIHLRQKNVAAQLAPLLQRPPP
jgi:hypothetical protein